MFDFAEQTKNMTAAEILNYYRNLYYAEAQVTERGIVANAINDILPEYARQQADAIREFAERISFKLANNTDISCVGYQSIIAEIDATIQEMTEDNP